MASKRQLLLELLASDKTGPATKGAAENLADVAAAAEDAAKATDNLGEQAEQTKEEVERFGKSNKSAAEHAAVLKHEIESTEHELHQLAIAFAEAETAADRADFSKAIRKTQSDLRKLNKGKSLVEELIPGADPVPVAQAARNIDQLKSHIKGLQTAFLSAGTVGGRSFLSKAIGDAEGELRDLEKYTGEIAPKIGQRLSESFAAIGEQAGPALAGVAVVAAPAIGALISGAVIGGAGIGGIVGGVLVASKDPRVTAAASAMKSQIGAELKDAAKPFVQVSLDGIKEIGSAVQAVDFKNIFADSAKNAGPVIAGIDQAVRGLGDGVATLISRSGPVITELGAAIGGIGQHAGEFFDTISHGSAGAADSIHDLATALNTTLDVLGPVILGLTDIYAVAHKIGAAEQFFVGLLGPLGQVADLLSKTGVFGDKAAGSLTLVKKGTDSIAAATPRATEAIVTFTDALDAAASAGQGLYGSTTNVADAEASLEGSIKKNGKTLDLNTQKGRNNRTALLGVASALTNNYDNFVKVNGEGVKSAQMANNNRKKFIEFAESLGKSKTQAEALATQLGLLPRNVSINVHYSVTGREALDPSGHRLGYKADGGPVKKGHAYIVGEKRPELFVPDRDGTIIPSLDQMGGASGGQAGGGGGTLVIDIRGADSEMKRMIRGWIRTDNLLNT